MLADAGARGELDADPVVEERLVRAGGRLLGGGLVAQADGIGAIPPAPKGKNIWGSVTVSDRGQIVIPKDARDKFGLTGGTRLIVLSDESGIALIPAERFERSMKMAMEFASMQNKAD